MFQDKQDIDLTVHVHRKTQKAYLVSDDGKEASAVWIPISQIIEADTEGDAVVGAEITITIPEWLAYEKGLI